MARTKTTKRTKKADKGTAPDATATDTSVTKSAAERRTFAKPDSPGSYDGEVKNGFRWDKAASDWMDHRGIDFSSDSSQLPHNMEHTGDGSAEKPHNVRHVQRWS